MVTQVVNPANYSFSLYAIPTSVMTVVILIIGWLTLIRERSSPVGVAFFLMTLTISLWFFGFSCVYYANNKQIAFFWVKAAYLGVPFIPSATYTLSVMVMRTYQRQKKFVWISWALSALFSVAALKTDALIDELHRYFWGYYPKYGWLGGPFLVFFSGMTIAGFYNYWTGYRNATPRTIYQRRIRSFIIAIAVAHLGSIDFIAKYGIEVYPIGYLPILALIVTIAQAIWRYRTVDITPAFAAEQISNTITDALFVLDQESIVRLVNQAACELFGYTEQELIGKPVEKTIGSKLFSGQFETLIQSGTIQNYEVDHRSREGELRTLGISASMMRDHTEQPVAIVCVARDITERKRMEEELRSSEEYLKILFEFAPDPYYLNDLKGNFIDGNRAAEELVGYKKEDLIGRSFLKLSLLPPDQIPKAAALLARNAMGNPTGPDEFTLVRKDSTQVQVEITTFPTKIKGRALVLGLARDITEHKRMEEELRKARDDLEIRVQERTAELKRTNETLRTEINERKRAEKALRESGEKLKIIMENANDVIFQLSPLGIIKYLSPKVKELYGYDPKELIGKHFKKTTPMSEVPRALEALRNVLSGEIVKNFEINQIDSKGNIVHTEVNFTPIRERDKIIAVQGVMRDITERKLAEEALKESEERYRTLVESQQEGVAIIDSEEQFIFANPAAHDIFGAPQESLIGHNLKDFTDKESFVKLRTETKLRQAGKKSNYDFEIIRSDGEKRTLLVTASPRFDNKGKFTGTFGVFRDITDRKCAEEKIRASLEEKEVLLKEIHHRVKNNLQIISSLLYLQSKSIKEEGALYMFKESQNRIKSMALIHEKLYRSEDLARIDFAEYIRNLTGSLSRSYEINPNKVELKINVDKTSLGIDTAIPCGLIINELVSNSLKYAFPDGREGEINIDFHSDGDKLTLIVTDNGIGFPKDLDFRNTESLGLQLVNNLANQLNGNVELDGTDGTQFKITFAEVEHRKRRLR